MNQITQPLARGFLEVPISREIGLLSFNVPSDLRGDLQFDLTRAMNEDETFIECIFVRSTRGIKQRAIILAIRDINDLEAGVAS